MEETGTRTNSRRKGSRIALAVIACLVVLSLAAHAPLAVTAILMVVGIVALIAAL